MPASKPKPERTLQLHLTKDVFNRHFARIRDALPPSVHSKPNSKYSTKTIVEYIMMMCAEGASHEGISQRWQDKMDKRAVPTGACLLKRIGGSPYMVTRDCCDRMLAATLNDPQTAAMLRKPVITATDEHDVPAMFKELEKEYMATGKPKGGTSKRLRYTTIKVVGGSMPMTIAVHPTGMKHNRAHIARQLLEGNRRAGIQSRMHLLDRGYYTADIMSVMMDMKQKFIVPAKRNGPIVDIIESYDRGECKALQRYTVQGKSRKATITLVITPKKNAKEDDPPKDRYLVFATNFGIHEARSRLADIPKIYKKRWGIETGYRVAKQIRPFTSSRNPSVRLVLFYFTMILYNLWVLSGWIANGRPSVSVYVPPPITMYRMMAAIYDACEYMIINDITSEKFFAEVVV